jgi:hypothetical protein
MKQVLYWGPTVLDWLMNLICYLALSTVCIWTYIFVCTKSTALIMLKILVATVQNLVARVTRRPDLCIHGLACGWKLYPLLSYLTLVLLTGYEMYPGLVFSSTDLGGIEWQTYQFVCLLFEVPLTQSCHYAVSILYFSMVYIFLKSDWTILHPW